MQAFWTQGRIQNARSPSSEWSEPTDSWCLARRLSDPLARTVGATADVAGVCVQAHTTSVATIVYGDFEWDEA